MVKISQYFSNWRASGRIKISAFAKANCNDLLVLLSGGEKHVGAVCVAGPWSINSLSVPGHREEALSQELAKYISTSLDCRVVVCAGIHYDKITKAEITQVIDLTHLLGEDIVAFYKEGVFKC